MNTERNTGINFKNLYMFPKKETLKPKLDQETMFYVLWEDSMNNIPDEIAIHESLGAYELNHKGKSIKGYIYLISGIGQSIHDWVKDIGMLWINSMPFKNNWVLVKAE